MKFQWKRIDNSSGQLGTFRAKVFGGWMLRYTEEFYTNDAGNAYQCTQNMEFIPDPDHIWEIEELLTKGIQS